jgi:hypothetical protein
MVWRGKAFDSAATVESGARVCGQNLMKSRIHRATVYGGIDPGHTQRGRLVIPTEIHLQITLFEDIIQRGKFCREEDELGAP